MRMCSRGSAAAARPTAPDPPVSMQDSVSGSTCFGGPANGRIEHAIALPAEGPNFSSYAQLGMRLGRIFVHATVRDITVNPYRDLEDEQTGIEFIYGEIGRRHDGPMPPHRPHQAGVSVDFMVPCATETGIPPRTRKKKPAEAGHLTASSMVSLFPGCSRHPGPRSM